MKIRFIVVALSLTVSLRLWAVPACPELRVKGVDYIPYYDPVTGNGTELPRMVDSKHYVPMDTEKVCVIMVNFPGGPDFDTTTFTPAYFTKLVFSDILGENSMYSYYQEVSYGKLTIVGAVHGPFTLPESLLYYSKDSAGVYDRNLSWRLIRDACSAADGSINFVDYDYDADGKVDHVMVVHSARDQSTGANAGSSIWPVRWGNNLNLGPFDGKEVDWGTIVSYSCQVGTFAHEFCHDIGMPDLYDYDSGFFDVHDNNDHPVEEWCLMASGNWMPDIFGTAGAGPSHICGFLKWQLGWITPITLTKDTTGVMVFEIELHDSESLYRIPISANEFFLVENRNSASLAQYDHWSKDYSGIGGPNQQLRDPGLIIMHVDMNLWNPPPPLRFNDGTPTRPHYGAWVKDPSEDLSDFPYETKYYAAYAEEGFETQLNPYSEPNSGGYYGPTGIWIADISNSGTIMTFDLDIKDDEEIMLTSDNYDHEYPQWSPDGKWVVYVKFTEGECQINKIPSGGGAEIVVASATAPYYSLSYPQWSPDGNWIVYVKRDTTYHEQIYKVSSSGGEEIALTSIWEKHWTPQWSPDGNWIVYFRNDTIYPHWEQIYKVSSSGGPEIQLTFSSNQHHVPQWSPDGDWIIFQRKQWDGSDKIYKVPSSGGAEISLTDTIGYPFFACPQWSPDGDWIICTGTVPGPCWQICKLSSNGDTLISLTSDTCDNICPEWSPDGDWIAYMKEYQIYVVSSSGGEEIALTSGPLDWRPQWSPDGKWIVYQAPDHLGYDQIFAVPFIETGVEEPSWTEKPTGESPVLTCYPNPFNHLSVIKYRLPSSGAITLKVYNIVGQLVRTLVDAPEMAGYYQVTWDGRDNNGRKVASGVYFYRLEIDRYVNTKRMTFIK